MRSVNTKPAAFEIRGWSLCNIQQDIAFDEPYVMRMLEAAGKWDINYIEFIGPYYNQPERCPIDSLVTYREFPKLNGSQSMPRDLQQVEAENAKFNRLCTRAKSLGMATTVWCHELWFPRDILEFYPEMGDDQGHVVYTSKAFQRFLRSKYEELFETIPDLSGIVLTTAESLALNIFALPAEADHHLSKYDAYIHMLNTVADVCAEYGRHLYVRMFGLSNEERFYAVAEAFKRVDPAVRIHQKTCDHGDWHNPFQKANDRHGAFEGRFEIAEEELGQEYFGVGDYPVVYPEVLQHRARNAQDHGVRGMVGRIDRASYGSVEESHHNRPWDHEGQLNIVAFSTLLWDPNADLAQVAWKWADDYFGPAHPYALKALEQGVGIFHDIFYVYPGEDAARHWRGRWLEPRVMMDEKYGVFGALREARGYRTPKELALIRCERSIGDLYYGEHALGRCTDEQVRRYRVLQEKFGQLQAAGQQRLALLTVYAAFADLFFEGYSVIKHRHRFLEAVDQFVSRYGKATRADELRALFDLLRACGKLDANTFDGYCAAGEV